VILCSGAVIDQFPEAWFEIGGDDLIWNSGITKIVREKTDV